MAPNERIRTMIEEIVRNGFVRITDFQFPSAGKHWRIFS
jgi:hypothetical protein